MDDSENPENSEVVSESQDQENSAEATNTEISMEESLSNFSDTFQKALGPDSQVKGLEAVFDVPVQVSAVLGRASMPVHQLLKLGRGAVIELDRRVGESIDIYVNNLLVARGEVVVVDDKLGITMTEIIKTSTYL